MIVALTLSLASAGCASQIMQGYVGQPIQEVMLDYGPPVNAFDMPDGTRAFQWSMSSTYVTPTTVNTTTIPAGNVWMTNTQISGGQPITSTCVYTMFGRWDEAQRTWILESFRRPNVMCE